MIERGIGIAGVGLAVIFGATEYFQSPIPGWVSPAGAGVGLFLLGVSGGLIWSGHRANRTKPRPAERALLRLHVYGGQQFPDRLAAESVFRWYYLSHILVVRGDDATEKEVHLPTLFVAFDPEVKISTLKVRSPDMALPRHEVKEFNQRFAIIVFSEKLAEGTLEVRVEP